MMEDNYPKAFKEIVEILKYVPEESVNQIPKEMRDLFEEEQLRTYSFQIDTEKPFEEQELLEETKAILANIFRDYWATDYQRARIIEKENKDRETLEGYKAEQYNPDTIFKNINRARNDNKEKIDEDYNKNLPVEVKEKFYNKIINFFKKLFQLK